MNYIFFGTPDVALETLEHLVEKGFRPSLVVTNPDAPKGRGRVMTPSPVKDWAEKNQIKVITPERLDEVTVSYLASQNAELAIVVAYGKILPESLIKSFSKGVLNVHYSLLPKYRGAAPVEYALLNDEPVTGVTIQQMVRELDAGDILSQEQIDVMPEDTTVTLRKKLISLGADLLVKTLPEYLAGSVVLNPQDPSAVTLAPKLKKEDGLLDMNAPAQVNWNKYRAYAVWPGTYYFKDDKRIKITKARFEDGQFIIDRVIPEGQKEVSFSDFSGQQ